MKTREGLLRYDALDLESWCFDLGEAIMPVFTGLEVRIRIDDHFEPGTLRELPDGGLNVILGSQRGNHQSAYGLDPGKWYLANVSLATLEALEEKWRSLEWSDMEQSDGRRRSETDAQG